MDEDYSTIARAQGRRSARSGMMGIGLGLLLLALVLAGLAWWGGWGPSDVITVKRAPPVVVAPVPTPSAAASEATVAQARQAVAQVQQVVQQQGGLDSRVAAMEQRLSKLDLQLQAASGNAARTEGLLVAFAARRAVERGAPLGYLADQLQLRFGEAHPNSVRTIIDFSHDPVTLDHIRQAGATGVVSALHDIYDGRAWPLESILERKRIIEAAGLTWSVVESIPVHNSIKIGSAERLRYVGWYKETIRALAKAGIATICYNFMPVVDWTRTDLAYRLPTTGYALRFDAIDFARGHPDPASEDAKIAANRRDFQARFDRARLLIAGQRWTAAMDELLEILMRDKAWNEDLARKTYIAVLEIIEPPRPKVAEGQIPPDDPTVATYRRRLSSVVLS